jgi:hypothetical protein
MFKALVRYTGDIIVLIHLIYLLMPQEMIRLAQANAELKRFQLLRRLDSIKVSCSRLLLLFIDLLDQDKHRHKYLLQTRRNFEISESALASLNGIRAYFHHCSDMIDTITPQLGTLQEKQAQSRKKHDAKQAPWESKQKSLTNAIGEVRLNPAMTCVYIDRLDCSHTQQNATT